MQDYRKLIVFEKARTLALRIDEAMKPLKRRDGSGFASQARRAALSIPSNIAEGCSRATNREFARYIHIAIGSASELEYQLEFASDTKLISAQEADGLRERAVEVRRMLYGLLKKVRNSPRL